MCTSFLGGLIGEGLGRDGMGAIELLRAGSNTQQVVDL